ncbi:acyltransferase ChoActase/COT/CPT [Clavulina sp. PMI_390]|nr:acyltransferase ChoActase/COT/CPT [Clavulina sp. PMI_390]
MAPAASSAKRSLTTSKPRRSDDVPEGYVRDPNLGPTYAYQASLPHLPVPTLASTTAKYLESVQPHLTPEEYSKTKKVVESFAASDLAKKLQDRLLARAADTEANPSWLADWWNEAAYMGYRDPVVVFVSYYFVHIEDKLRKTPEKRAAALIRAMLPFRELVETQQLQPDKVRKAPLCMSSYKWLFNSSRYPVKPNDTATKFDPQTHNHVLFIRNNKFYTVQLEHDGVQLSTTELESQISKIIAKAAASPAGPAIGALTSENRDIWADARTALLKASPSGLNAASLEKIESAVIVVALDAEKPVTRDEVSWHVWTGDAKNRWFDKHQFVVFDNGRSGFLGEHSCMDGTPTLRMNEFVCGNVVLGKVDNGSVEVRQGLPEPEELQWEVNAEVAKYVGEAEKHYDELIGAHGMDVLHYEGYGASFIKKFKASPDAWAQLVKQLAFYKLFNRPPVVYESCQTRKFQLGRTEVIRSTSNESLAFVKAMEDVKETDAHRATLFRRAVTRHLQYAAWAADGQGVDRHLFGLKKLLKEGEAVPEIYTDKAFGQTNHWELSTSQLSSPWFDGWGYGEVVPDGYGLSYGIGADHIRWTITSVKDTRDGKLLKHYLAEAATEVRIMMENAAKEEATKEGTVKAKL